MVFAAVVIGNILAAGVVVGRIQHEAIVFHQPGRLVGVEGLLLLLLSQVNRLKAERLQIELATVERQPQHLLTSVKIELQWADRLEAGETAGIRQVDRGAVLEAAILLKSGGDGFSIRCCRG